MHTLSAKRFFKQLAIFQLKYRCTILLTLAFISVIGMMGLSKVQILSDDKNLIAKSDEQKQNIEEFEEIFGNSEHIAILVEAEDVFHPEVLEAIKTLGAELLERVPYAKSLMSITDIDVTIGTDEGLEILHPFSDGIPQKTEKIEKLRRLILSRPSLSNKIVSSDCKEAWIVLSLHPFPSDIEEGKKEGSRVLAPMYKAGEAAIACVTDPKWQSDKYTFKAAGTPYTEMEERIVIKEETLRTVLVSFSIMVLLLIIFTMSLSGTIIPVASLILGISLVFGVMGHLGIIADSNMVSIPILLAMALSVGYSIHLINSFKHYFYLSGKRREAVIESIEETGWPLFFTVITTVVSVLSFLTTSIYSLRWLGAACGATVLSVYIFTATIIPIFMSFGKDGQTENLANKKEARLFSFVDDLFARFSGFVIRRKHPILIVSSLIFVSCLPGLLKIQIKMDGHTFLGRQIPYIRRLDHIANSSLGSYFNYTVMLKFEDADALKLPNNLQKIEELERFIASLQYTKKTNGQPKIFSLLPIIKEMRQSLNAEDASFYSLPKTEEELAQMLFLYEISGGELTQWVDDEFKTARLKVEVATFDTEDLNHTIHVIKAKGRELLPEAKIALIGEAIDFANINDHIVQGELSSMTFSLLAIFVLMWIVFGSLKLALIGMVPNIAPLFAIGAVMGYSGIYLDMVTMTIMPMLLGISVDDTIYFISHAKMEYSKASDYVACIAGTFRSIGKTLLATSIILCIGFASNSVSHLTGILKIGLLGAFGFFVALVADYFLTPVLLYIARPFRQ